MQGFQTNSGTQTHMPTDSFRKTRLAPTPSGFLHVGNILSFAITAAIAGKTGARIFLRIDDVDRERTNKLYVQDIFDTLNFMEIPWDEGPTDMKTYEREYSQMCRMDLYHEALRQLMDSGAVFACTCSRATVHANNAEGRHPGDCRDKHLPYKTPGACLRQNTAGAKEIGVHVYRNGVVVDTLPADVHDFIVRKKDGFPAYQLTSLIDDLHFGIDLVVRGEDLWPSTLAQLYLSKVLERPAFSLTTFYHHPLLMGGDGMKLSKSAGATSVQHLRKEGRKPAYIYTLIAGMCGVNAPVNSYNELIAAIGTNLLSI